MNTQRVIIDLRKFIDSDGKGFVSAVKKCLVDNHITLCKHGNINLSVGGIKQKVNSKYKLIGCIIAALSQLMENAAMGLNTEIAKVQKNSKWNESIKRKKRAELLTELVQYEKLFSFTVARLMELITTARPNKVADDDRHRKKEVKSRLYRNPDYENILDDDTDLLEGGNSNAKKRKANTKTYGDDDEKPKRKARIYEDSDEEAEATGEDLDDTEKEDVEKINKYKKEGYEKDDFLADDDDDDDEDDEDYEEDDDDDDEDDEDDDDYEDDEDEDDEEDEDYDVEDDGKGVTKKKKEYDEPIDSDIDENDDIGPTQRK
jgi:hypothetical protein